MKVFLFLISGILLSANGWAGQPRADAVIKAFLHEPAVVTAMERLKAEGWSIGEPSATMALAAWNDEGTEGVYLVSVYYEKGSHPWNKRNGVLTGVADFTMGFIAKLKLVDSNKAARALLSLD